MGVLDTLAAATPNRRTVTVLVDGKLQSKHDALLAQLDDAVRADINTAKVHASLGNPTGTGQAVSEKCAAVTGSGRQCRNKPVDGVHCKTHGGSPDATASAAPAEPTAVQRVAQQLEDIRDRVLAARVTFEIEAMDWRERIDLQAAHPPRDHNAADAARNYNVATYVPELIRSCAVSFTDGLGDTVTELPDATWARLLGSPEDGIKAALNYNAINDLTSAATRTNDAESPVPPSARSLLETQASGASSTQPRPGESPHDDSEGGSRPGSPSSSTTPPDTSSLGSPRAM